MSKFFKILVCSLFVFLIAGCGEKETLKKTAEIGEESKTEIVEKNVSLKVKPGTLSNSGVTLIMENHSDYPVGYGEPYHIEKEVDGKWHYLKTINTMVFILPLYTLDVNQSKELSFGWSYGYGELATGKYRIIKDICFRYDDEFSEDFSIAGEFVIE